MPRADWLLVRTLDCSVGGGLLIVVVFRRPPVRRNRKTRTAASGTLPTEHTKLSMATSGPTSRPSMAARVGLSHQEESSPEGVGHPGGERLRDQQTTNSKGGH
jgi:hypothetical protein